MIGVELFSNNTSIRITQVLCWYGPNTIGSGGFLGKTAKISQIVLRQLVFIGSLLPFIECVVNRHRNDLNSIDKVGGVQKTDSWKRNREQAMGVPPKKMPMTQRKPSTFSFKGGKESKCPLRNLLSQSLNLLLRVLVLLRTSLPANH